MRLGKGTATDGNVVLSGLLGAEPECNRVGENNALCVKLNIRTENKKVDGEWQSKWDYVTCWRELAEIASKFRKGDSVLAAGTYHVREYNDKKYTDVTADFVCKASVHTGGLPSAPEDERPLDISPDNFSLIDESEDLPF